MRTLQTVPQLDKISTDTVFESTFSLCTPVIILQKEIILHMPSGKIQATPYRHWKTVTENMRRQKQDAVEYVK